jgi:hypothetical protein
MKDIEKSLAVKDFKYKNGNGPQKRRQEDKTRDYKISVYNHNLTKQ